MPNTFQKVKLFFTAHNILDVDITSISDAFFVLTHPNGNATYSDCIQNDLNPKFTTSTIVYYYPQENGLYHVALKDHDVGKFMTSKNTFLGSCSFGLQQLMLCGTLSLPLEGVEHGELMISFEIVPEDAQLTPKRARLDVIGENIGDKFTSLQILRLDQSSIPREVVSTPSVEGRNPTYTPLSLCLYELCKNNMDCPIILRISKTSNNIQKFDFISEVTTSPAALLKACRTEPVRLQLCDKKGKGTKSFLIVEAFDTSYNYSLKDFIENGFNVSLAVCIDFCPPKQIVDPSIDLNCLTKSTPTPPENKEFSRLWELSSTHSAHAVKPQYFSKKPASEQSDEEIEEQLQAWGDNLFIRAIGRYLGGFIELLGISPFDVPINAFQTFNSLNKPQLSEDTKIIGVEHLMQSYVNAICTQKSNMKSQYNHISNILQIVIESEFPHYKEPLELIKLKYPEEASIYPVLCPQTCSIVPLTSFSGAIPKFSVLFYFTESDTAFGVKFDEFTPSFVYVDHRSLPLLVMVVNVHYIQTAHTHNNLEIKRLNPSIQTLVDINEVGLEFDRVGELYDTVEQRILDYLASYKVSPQDLGTDVKSL